MSQNVKICESGAAGSNLVMTRALWERSAIRMTPSALINTSAINITIGLRSLETLGALKHVTGLQKKVHLRDLQDKGVSVRSSIFSLLWE
jgi:hypothetical protein